MSYKLARAITAPYLGNEKSKSPSRTKQPITPSDQNQDLRRERAKMTALVEELELPLNVHRWRKLESSDPERYDLVRKAQSLQRNIVAKTESIVKKDLLIQEKVRARELLSAVGCCTSPRSALM